MTEEDIKHLANLAKLKISDEDLSRMKTDFDNLLWFVGKLQSIDTNSIEMMYTPIDSNKLDYQRITDTKIDSQNLLENSPNQISDNAIVIKSSTVEH